MTLARSVVHQSPIYAARIEGLVERCLQVASISSQFRQRCTQLEAEIDWIIMGDGTTPERFICTSAHSSGDGEDGVRNDLCLAGSFKQAEGMVDRAFLFGRNSLICHLSLPTSKGGS